MADIIETLRKTRGLVVLAAEQPYLKDLTNAEALLAEIDSALANPEIKIAVPLGKLVAGIGHNESDMAYIDLETEWEQKNLFVAECVNEELREENEQEGDIRLYTWGDIAEEDYTSRTDLSADAIREHYETLEEKERNI